MTYPSFAKGDKPEKFNYNTSKLTKEGYEYRLEADKRNPDFEKFYQDQKNDGNEIQVIELDEPNKVHVWIKK